jgi:hypothetical protein
MQIPKRRQPAQSDCRVLQSRSKRAGSISIRSSALTYRQRGRLGQEPLHGRRPNPPGQKIGPRSNGPDRARDFPIRQKQFPIPSKKICSIAQGILRILLRKPIRCCAASSFLAESPQQVINRRRASWPAATGAPQRLVAMAGGHGFGLEPQAFEHQPFSTAGTWCKAQSSAAGGT